MRLTSFSAALVAALIALTGCGGTSTPASTSAAAGTHPDAPPPAHADTNPHHALIGLADLSSTWRSGRPFVTEMTCDGWDPLRGAARTLGSARFYRTPVEIQQTIGVFTDAAAGDAAFRRLNSGATQRCVRRALRRRMRFSSGGGIAFVSPVTVIRVERLGKHSHGIRYATNVNSELGRRQAYIVTINSRIGDAASSLTVVTGEADSLAEAAYDQLVAAAERHLEAVYG